MNTNALRLFLHVMQRGSLVAAATELNMSPSAASRLLMGLERETGLVLFSRHGKRLHPTAEGKQYFSECYRVLVAVDDFSTGVLLAWQRRRSLIPAAALQPQCPIATSFAAA